MDSMLIAARPASSATILPVNGCLEASGSVPAVANELLASIRRLLRVLSACKKTLAPGGLIQVRGPVALLASRASPRSCLVIYIMIIIFRLNMMIIIPGVKLNICGS
ncbi:hypothetical protein D3C85_1414740 [compost metagenome]